MVYIVEILAEEGLALLDQSRKVPGMSTGHPVRVPRASKMKIARPKGLTIFMAGEEGLEPPNARTKTWCLTTWPLPIVILRL